MEREDRRKFAREEWDANYGPGRRTVDESTTTFSGSRREADLVVRGLRALRAVVALNEAAGVERTHDGLPGLGSAPRPEELDELIASIGKPNYVGETEVVDRILAEEHR